MNDMTLFHSEDAPTVSSENARRRVSTISPNIAHPVIWQMGGEQTEQSYRRSDLMHSLADGVHFKGCDFTDAAGNGVIWRNNRFSNCLFERSDFEFADLSYCIIDSVDDNFPRINSSKITGSGFNGSILRGATITKTNIQGSSFAQCDFTDTLIENCKISSATFEDSIFNNSKLIGVDFTGTNPEYADFSNANLFDITICLEQLPFIYVIKLNLIDSERISVVKSRDDRTPLSINEILTLIDAVAVAYNEFHSFFAGASLYYLFNKYNRFGYQIRQGIKDAIVREDYRSLKHMCKLCSIAAREKSLFTSSDLRMFYSGIVALVQRSANPAARNHYRLHDGLIKGYLLAEINPNTLHISFTLISSDVNSANIVLANVLSKVVEVCNNVGVTFDILKTEAQVYSNPKINVTIGNINVNINRFSRDTEKIKDNSSDARDGDSARGWNSYTKYAAVVATISLLFSGINLFINAHTDNKMPQLSINNTYYVIEQYEEIKHHVESNTFRISLNDDELRNGVERILDKQSSANSTKN